MTKLLLAKRLAAVAAEGEEGELTGVVVALEAGWHCSMSLEDSREVLDASKVGVWSELLTSHPSRCEGWGTVRFEVGEGWSTSHNVRWKCREYGGAVNEVLSKLLDVFDKRPKTTLLFVLVAGLITYKVLQLTKREPGLIQTINSSGDHNHNQNKETH